MTESTQIKALPRGVIGKANRRLAGDGLIPAVLYGPARDTTPLSLFRHEFELFMQRHAGSPGLVELEIAGIPESVSAMVKDVQVSAVKGRITHVDFLAIRMDRPVHATIALHFVGEAPGVKAGGVMLHEVREVNVEALPSDLPDFLEVDVSNLEIGSTMTIGDIVTPAGVTILDDPEGVICSVTAPRVEISEEEAGAPTEPEVIGGAAADSKGD